MAWTTPGTAVAGDVLTAAFWNSNVRDNSDALYQSTKRITYIQRTTEYTSTATAVASASDVFSSDLSWTADGTSAYQIEFYCPFSYTGTILDNSLAVYLVNGSGTSLGVIAVTGPSAVSSKRAYSPIFVKTFYTPAAGTASINVRGVSSAGSDAGLVAGTATGTERVAMYLAVYGPDIT
jgi:hypothetical protein